MAILDAHMIRNLNLRLLIEEELGATSILNLLGSVRVIYAGEIRNYREDNSMRSFCKVEYRQFISARHGHLGKGNMSSFLYGLRIRRRIRRQYSSLTCVNMGY